MLLSTTQLMWTYSDWFQTEGRPHHSCLDNFCQKQIHKCPVKGATRELYRLLATAICMYSEPLIDQMLRACIAASLKFPASCVAQKPAAGSEQFSYLSSEMATINALDLPNTLRHFPVGEGDLQGTLRCSWGGTRCERFLKSRMRDVYFPMRSAKLLINWKLKELLRGAIDEVSARLFVKMLSTKSEGTIADSSCELIRTSSQVQQPAQQKKQVATAVDAAAAALAVSALNTDGSNSYRQPHDAHQQQYQGSHKHQQQSLETSSSATSLQQLCRMHASGAKQPVGESSCAVCAARYFLQQHLARISRYSENLRKLERTLRDCKELQTHWNRSLQWIAANVKENRLPKFVRPLVNTCCSDDGSGRTVTVNPQIIVTTEAQLNDKRTWQEKIRPDPGKKRE